VTHRLRNVLATVALVALATGCSMSYQGNAGHTGAYAPTMKLPLTPAWTASFDGPPSYAVVAGGFAFVTAKGPGSGYGTVLHAIDVQTGLDRWSAPLGGTYWWSGIASDTDTVYAVNFNGLLQAFHTSDGTVRWSVQLPGQSSFSSAPTVRDGRVFVGGAGSGGTLYAVDTANGAVLWTASVANGDNSSPAVSDDTVFVSYACNYTYAFAVATGALRWHSSPPCSGGGGKTTVYDAQSDSLYVRDGATGSALQLDASNGAVRHSYPLGTAPAIGAQASYVVHGGTLTSISLANGTINWNMAGDGTLATAPIVVGGDYVLVGATSGKLYAFDATTGATRWSTNVGAAIPGPDEQNVSQPLAGLAQGYGLVFVPTSTGKLIAYKAAP
jgi:outer membrane protein assembly factor BamB